MTISRVLTQTSRQQLLQLLSMLRGEAARFDLVAVVPIAATRALDEITPDRQATRLPLAEHVEVLVQHELRIAPEITGRSAQEDAVAARGGTRAAMQPGVPRILDHPHLAHRLPEYRFERRGDGNGYLAARHDLAGAASTQQLSHARITPDAAIEIETALQPCTQRIIRRERRQVTDTGHPQERAERYIVGIVR